MLLIIVKKHTHKKQTVDKDAFCHVAENCDKNSFNLLRTILYI